MNLSEISYKIIGLDCASCGKNLENKLLALKGINDVRINIAYKKIFLKFTNDITEEEIIQQIEKSGYSVYRELDSDLRRKSEGMSIGVLVGSNITNPLFGVGVGALISTYTVSERIRNFDLPIWFFVSVVALLFFWRKLKIERREAIILILMYIAYAWIRLVYIK